MTFKQIYDFQPTNRIRRFKTREEEVKKSKQDSFK